jgi:hypothetical protein
MGEVRSLPGAATVTVGAAVGETVSGVDVSTGATVGVACAGETVIVPIDEAGGGVVCVAWQAVLRKIRMSRQGKNFVFMKTHFNGQNRARIVRRDNRVYD